MNKKAHRLLTACRNALARHGPATRMATYRPCDAMVLYGWGGEEQQRAIRQHAGPYACFDLGYWDRTGADRAWRVSINGFHSPDRVMRGGEPPPRPYPPITTRYDPAGPILLVGNAPKSRAVGAEGWTAGQVQPIRTAFPGVPIWYRPKPGRAQERVRADRTIGGPIQTVLRRCRLVVCRHSNVAVDAAVMGVPVVASDGAAGAIYPRRLADWARQPSGRQREAFLRRLAWWQWRVSEMDECVDWMKSQLRQS